MNKPAMTININNNYEFFIWPSKLTDKEIDRLTTAGVNVYNRNIDPISQSTGNSELVMTHIKRAVNLANKICDDIQNIVIKYNAKDIYVCSEGLSYGSSGDAVTNLATYKGILLSKLYESFNSIKAIYTYSPTTLKSTAGCAKKTDVKDKNKMINAFINENINHIFGTKIDSLKNKTNYVKCVDDIVDSYWAVKTMIIKEF